MSVHLERHQALLYLASIIVGLAMGMLVPRTSGPMETLVWPTLGLLLYSTFVQVPLTHLPAAIRDGRFISAVLVGNFMILPPLVWALSQLVDDDPAVRVGVLLVLLMPCTDWFLTFTHLAGGDTRRGIAVTPINLLVQLGLLPAYLWLFLGESFTAIITGTRVTVAFTTLIVLPLAAAWATQRRLERRDDEGTISSALAALPVPLLALVVFLIAASQAGVVLETAGLLPRLLAVYVLFLVLASAAGLGIAHTLGLPPRSARALVFSLGTRNSFVVLPFALALPDGFEIAVVVVVFQSLVELFGMVAYLRAIPRLIPADAGR